MTIVEAYCYTILMLNMYGCHNRTWRLPNYHGPFYSNTPTTWRQMKYGDGLALLR